jgi:HlyD family secretion protein
MSNPSGTQGKVVRLKVTPLQAAQLALDTSGIVGEWNLALGTAVTAFNFAAFYAVLGNTVTGSPAQLQYDSQGIQTAVTASNLLALRAESQKAALDAAIAARANAYYAKYGNQAAIIAQMQTYYSPTVAFSKPFLLASLSKAAQDQANALQAAYTLDGRTGVVRTTTSALKSTTTSTGFSFESDKSTTTGSETTQGSDVDYLDETVTQLPSGRTELSPPPLADETIVQTTTTPNLSGTDTSETNASGSAGETGSIINTGYGYRVPSIEAAARNFRAQASLIDEQFAQFMAGQNLPYLAQVFGNELAMIDLAVKRLQVAYLNTIMLSPIDGIVTGIFTNLGDPVKAGDVIVRVENNQTVLLEGTVVYREMISVGDTVTVQTTLFSDPSQPTSITGTVAAARGHESHDDWWDIAVNCTNTDSSGNPIFPLHYSFDYDDTTVVIS